ncbi:CoA transferase [Aromatoleum toluclasticum]|uniref:CoA transferase n=1 Tax=Aromatoleum toluclasticum TaxID=92003 RepID=UPI001D183357|nr:CoA transferase [Aromatoleum toluclasticum]MCC4117526.1 CoA transferase [Aromatoleum toluclasticum]
MAPVYPLAGLRVALGRRGHASDYARSLLTSLGAECEAKVDGEPDEHPALSWRRSGLMALTGRAGGAGRMCPLPLTASADGALAALSALGSGLRALPGSGATLMGVRARFAGLARQGALSPGGTCRLLACRDGELAINLARPDDWVMVPAWLECDCAPDWGDIAARVSERGTDELLERARLLGLAAAASTTPRASPWLELNLLGMPRAPRPRRPDIARPLVIDLSSLWAGPLCGQLFRELGAYVIKVESAARPDGARRGPAAFFDLLNAGKASVQLDLDTPAGRDRLRELVDHADIVIEASRPRALRQMGIHAEDWLAGRSGRSWLSITGHGRQEPHAGWVAFGDDAGVGAGLSELMQRATGERLICGDAIGDPLTGLHAALAAWASWRAGGGHLLALSLDSVLRHCVSFGSPRSDDALHERYVRWTRVARSRRDITPAPLCFAPRSSARPLGADTAAVLSDLGRRAA